MGCGNSSSQRKAFNPEEDTQQPISGTVSGNEQVSSGGVLKIEKYVPSRTGDILFEYDPVMDDAINDQIRGWLSKNGQTLYIHIWGGSTISYHFTLTGEKAKSKTQTSQHFINISPEANYGIHYQGVGKQKLDGTFPHYNPIIYDLHTYQEFYNLDENDNDSQMHTSKSENISFSSDEKYLCFGGSTKKIGVLDLKSKTIFDVEKPLTAKCTFIPNTHTLVCYDYGKSITVYEINSNTAGKEITKVNEFDVEEPGEFIRGIKPNLVAAFNRLKGEIYFYDLEMKKCTQTLETKMKDIKDVVFLNSDYVAVSDDKKIDIFDINRNEVLQTCTHNNYKLYDFYPSHDGRYIIASYNKIVIFKTPLFSKI